MKNWELLHFINWLFFITYVVYIIIFLTLHLLYSYRLVTSQQSSYVFFSLSLCIVVSQCCWKWCWKEDKNCQLVMLIAAHNLRNETEMDALHMLNDLSPPASKWATVFLLMVYSKTWKTIWVKTPLLLVIWWKEHFERTPK